jgi:FlaA1/EpsC-like NDP-sugar epimerase
MLDFNESGLFDLESDIKFSFSQAPIESIVANINDKDKIEKIISELKPDVVFHAAAYKHVPLMEQFPEEAVKTNVFGTLNVAEAAIKNNVDKFVLISTDKAIKPISVMGQTKRLAELIVQDLNKKSKTKFISVRFGNVIGSRGSVIPLFEEQIKRRMPVTVTHPDMTRYFMTIPEAALLVTEAGAVGKGGEIFMLDMGKPIKILDLAKEAIKLAGLVPDVDIPIVFTGVRPGEKISEVIFSDEEKRIGTTQWDKIFITKNEKEVDEKLIKKTLDDLSKAIEQKNYSAIKEILNRVAN